MSRLRQFGLLMHKNWILQKRKVCVTVFEILMPVIFGLLLLFIRNLISTDSFPNGKIWDNVNASELTSNFNKTEILYSPNTGKIVTIMSAMETEIKTKYPRITGKYFFVWHACTSKVRFNNYSHFYF